MTSPGKKTKKPAAPLDLAHIQHLAERLKLVSDPTRLTVLLFLREQTYSVGELSASTGCSVTALSRHLAFLRLSGLIEARRDNQRQIYSLTQEGQDLSRMIAVLEKS